MMQNAQSKDTITRRELCELTGLSMNTLNGRLNNYKYTQLVPVKGTHRTFLYDRQKALEWIKEWDGEITKEPTIKLMILNVKPQKPKKYSQKMDKVKKPYYSQYIAE
jgi:hypothetical protein